MVTAATARANRVRRQRLLLGLGLLMLVGAAAYVYLKQPSAPAVQPQPKGTIAVPVAARALNKGTELEGAGKIRPMYLRPEQVPPAAILRTGQIQGRVTREALRPGDYFSESNLAPTGAPAGFSGLVSPGKRIVVIDSSQIIGTLGFVREGDYVDLLAISQRVVGGAGVRPPAGTTVQGGGSQPGAGGARSAPPPGGATGGNQSVTATLVAEAVRIVIPPARPASRLQPHFTVLEMAPQEAHVTTLAMAAGQLLRMVYRPFNDDSKVLPEHPVRENTRPPRDPMMIEVLDGVERSIVRATLD